MSSFKYKHLYGPVPSRRLGRSLGIDLVPFKVCSYDCIYCQLGSTGSTTVARREYVANDEILIELERKLSTDALPDYISLAGSGEPTLHSGIGKLIRTIKTITDVPVAVLTNGSLLWLPEVREALLAADLVLPSLDAGDSALFQLINRPDNSLDFEQMAQGLVDFTRCFRGEVWLEVFLLAGINDDDHSVGKIAGLVEQIKPARVQLNSVYRPPAEDYALGLTSTRIQQLAKLFPGTVEIISEVETVLAEPELHELSRQDEIISLIQRRPCTAADVATGLNMHLNDTLKQLSTLSSSGRLLEPSGRQGFYIVPKP
jgi:wyosine [tRNA(Phe)-imidazoG37] synthetase (radical SAM superfamily)